jgi:poly [ADP-ribose] polymerase
LIQTLEEVQQKYDMLNILFDIENAQTMSKKAKGNKKKSNSKQEIPKVPNPIDMNYKTLNADLNLLKASDPEFHLVSTYATNTMSPPDHCKLLHVWMVDRNNEDQRFSQFDHLANRKLLWHGTNCAVVASCIQGGLRIMPHSGGRVGKGIYLASEHGKSSAYTRSGNMNGIEVGLMFLVEAALGDEHHITRDDPSLQQAPPGKHSIVALGTQEPDEKSNATFHFDGKSVTVPQGKPVRRPNFNSNFYQSEYLIYNEAQHRIRFVCAFQF